MVNKPEDGNSLSKKTYSTRYGALFFFANTYHSWANRKQPKKNLFNDLKTLENFRSLILQFGVDDGAFINGVSRILDDKDKIYNGSTLTSNKVWDPNKDLMEKEIPKRIVNRYFNFVLPELHTSGVLYGTQKSKRKHSYQKPSLQLDDFSVVETRNNRNKRKLFPDIVSSKLSSKHVVDLSHQSNNYNKSEEEAVGKARISYATFNFPIRTQSSYKKNLHKLRSTASPLTPVNQNLIKSKQQHFICNNSNINNNNSVFFKSRTCPNTPNGSNRRPFSPPPLSYIDVGLFPSIHNKMNVKKKKARTNPNSASALISFKVDDDRQENDFKMPLLVPKFAYRPSALSAIKKSDILDCSAQPEIITKDKVVSRKQNLSVFGNSLPSVFSNTALSCCPSSSHDVDILDLDSLSECSDFGDGCGGDIDSGWESFDYSFHSQQDLYKSSFVGATQSRRLSEGSKPNNGATKNIPLNANESLRYSSSPLLSKHHSPVNDNETENEKNKDNLSVPVSYLLCDEGIDLDEGAASGCGGVDNQLDVFKLDRIASRIMGSLMESNDDHGNEVISVTIREISTTPSKAFTPKEDCELDRQAALLNQTIIGENSNGFELLRETNLLDDASGDTDSSEDFSTELEGQNMSSPTSCAYGKEETTEIKTELVERDLNKNKANATNRQLKNSESKNKHISTAFRPPKWRENTRPPALHKERKKIKKTSKKTKKKKFTRKFESTFDDDGNSDDLDDVKKLKISDPKKLKNQQQQHNSHRKKKTEVKEQQTTTTSKFKTKEKLSTKSITQNDNIKPFVGITNSSDDPIVVGEDDIEVCVDTIAKVDLKEFGNLNGVAMNTTDDYDNTNHNDIRGGDDGRRRNSNQFFEKRQRAARKRRAEIEEKRRGLELHKLAEMAKSEQKEQRQKQLEEEWRLEEEQRAQEKLAMVADEKARMIEVENERAEANRRRMIALDRERTKREAALARMSVLLAEREAEHQLRLAKEKLAREIEDALRAKEKQLLAAMEEDERLRYLAERQAEVERKRREEEHRARKLEMDRVRRERERERKIAELEAEFERAQQLKRRYLIGSFVRSRELLYLAQKISRAYTYSYFGKLPRVVDIDSNNNNNNHNHNNNSGDKKLTPGKSASPGYRDKKKGGIRDLPSLSELMNAMEKKDT